MPFTEELIQRLHALIKRERVLKPTPYRDGQNVTRGSASGAIIYLPPEAGDVPERSWLNGCTQVDLTKPGEVGYKDKGYKLIEILDIN